MTLLPARLPGVVSQEVSGETIALDPTSSTAHAMEGVTAAVWAMCDGVTTVEQAATALGVDTAEIESAVGVLAEAGLVVPNGVSRRAAVQRAALIAGGLAVASPLLSVLAPAASASASIVGGGGGGGAATERITNGGFETGDFTGWTVEDQQGGSGSWFVYTGSSGPQSSLPESAPPEGTHAATSDQTGPGSHVLYQDVTLPAGSSPQLSLAVFYSNYSGDFTSPGTLDFNTYPNQQYRIDIIDPAAQTDPFTLTVLQNVFTTQAGDASTESPTQITADLTAFAGRTIRLRFAEADNEGNMLCGVDRVSILA